MKGQPRLAFVMRNGGILVRASLAVRWGIVPKKTLVRGILARFERLQLPKITHHRGSSASNLRLRFLCLKNCRLVAGDSSLLTRRRVQPGGDGLSVTIQESARLLGFDFKKGLPASLQNQPFR